MRRAWVGAAAALAAAGAFLILAFHDGEDEPNGDGSSGAGGTEGKARGARFAAYSRSGGVSTREVDPANEVKLVNGAWVYGYQRLPVGIWEESLDTDVLFDEEPEKWFESEVWMNTLTVAQEARYGCFQEFGPEVESPCGFELDLGVQRVDNARGKVHAVRPVVSFGADDAVCQELANCIARAYVGVDAPFAGDGDWLAFKKTRRLHPTSHLSREGRLDTVRETVSSLKDSLRLHLEHENRDDLQWQRERRVLEASVEHMSWMLERMGGTQ